LIVPANLVGRGEAVFADPALDQPERMGEGASEGFGSSCFVFGIIAFSWRDGEFAQDGVHEGRGGALARAFYEFDTFMEGGALRDAIEPEELVKREAQSDQDLEVEFGQRL
jgi:hypothetical protein